MKTRALLHRILFFRPDNTEGAYLNTILRHGDATLLSLAEIEDLVQLLTRYEGGETEDNAEAIQFVYLTTSTNEYIHESSSVQQNSRTPTDT